ncbi:carbohydrate binding family 9 domain-containing protein [Flavisolibacter nicotianae]|uniref:carbohydrate binding family 9 domain-containing protein n=1 Tax=Flavisolibacter nicotianae TaxID=2364882 RepID=UPI0037441F27
MKKRSLVFLFSVLVCFCFGQKKNASYAYFVHPAPSAIVVDGLVEEGWQTAQTADRFFMVLPMDTSRAQVLTEVKLRYDNHNLYLLAICYTQGVNMVESMRRDFAFGKNDNFLVFIDPFEDGTNGFAFGTNAAGAQWDGLMYEGGSVDLSWDNKWTSAVKQYSDRWVLEMAIPFKTLRFKKGMTHWGINFSRNDLKTTEKSSWAPVPRQFPTASLAYTGTLVWDVPPTVPPTNISLIPYGLTGITRDYEKARPNVYRNNIGGDAKVAITSSLNLDLTVNPDFSQVEIDKQVTNLDRYELFFPEKRQFFLENGDQFNNFGYATIRPFFSRRIGLGVPIVAGARLSGKLDKNWRLGAMDMQTKAVDATGLPEQNFSVVALQRKIFSRSNIGFLFVNKQSLHYQWDPNAALPRYSEYNRNAGLEYNLASANNLWTGKLLFLKSFTPEKSGRDIAQAGNLKFANRWWTLGFQYEYTGRNYKAEVGYVPRQGYVRFNPQAAYSFFPKGGTVLSHGPQFTGLYYYDEHVKKTDNESVLSYSLVFRSKSVLTAVWLNDYVQLLLPFDPTNTGKDSLQKGSVHRWNTFGADYISKPQSVFTYDFSVRSGGYYAEGNKLTFAGNIGYRFQPYVNIAFSTSYNQLNLPKPWGNIGFWLVGPKIDVTFTNKLFLTTYVQYNQQQKNTNINARFQWRYKPASDLFIVYTDNYLISPFLVRNRALVMKLNYWLNL